MTYQCQVSRGSLSVGQDGRPRLSRDPYDLPCVQPAPLDVQPDLLDAPDGARFAPPDHDACCW